MRVEDDADGGTTREAPRKLGIADLLEHDLRPAFITEIAPKTTDLIVIVFLNASLRSNDTLGDEIKGKVQGAEGQKAWMRFRDWAMQPIEIGLGAKDAHPTLAFRRILWSRIALQNKWRVVSANEGDLWSNRSTHIGTRHSQRRVSLQRNKETIFPQRACRTSDMSALRYIWFLSKVLPGPYLHLLLNRLAIWTSFGVLTGLQPR
jgi:hypothetical protein